MANSLKKINNENIPIIYSYKIIIILIIITYNYYNYYNIIIIIIIYLPKYTKYTLLQKETLIKVFAPFNRREIANISGKFPSQGKLL